MNRRQLLTTTAMMPIAAALAACAGTPGTIPPIPININLPPEVVKFLAAVNDVIVKVEGSGAPAAALDLIAQLKAYVAHLKTNPPDLKTVVGYVATVIGYLLPFVPPPYNIAAQALVTLLNLYAGLKAKAVAAIRAGAPVMDIDEVIRRLEQ